jgi:hypothetical protein
MTKNVQTVRLDHRVDLYIPSQCICGGDLPGGLRNKVIEEVKSKFDAWFGSHTEAAIKGDWRLPDGTIAREEVADIYSFCAGEALEEHQEDVDRLAAHVADRLTQDRVLRVFDNLKVALYPNTLVPPPVPRKTCACRGKVHGIPGILPRPATAKRADRIPKMLIIQGILRSFSSIEYARMLFCDVLNYHYTSGEWPCGKWADSTRDLLTGAPALLAGHNGFKILYIRISGEGLQRGAKRQLIQRLFKDDPTFRGLTVFSDRHQKNWELVNIKVRSDDSSRIILRRMKVGMEAIYGTGKSKARMAARFSPLSNPQIEVRDEERVNILVATDVMSEGLNRYVLCQAGKYQQLFLTEPDGEIRSRDIPLVLGRIKCSRTEPAAVLPNDHNQVVMKVLKIFSDEVRHRRAQLQHGLSLTTSQNYVLRELRAFYR